MSQTKAQLLGNVLTDIQLNAQGDLRFADADSSNYVGFQAPATVSSNLVWTLPSADAGASGYALVSDGSGTLSWAAVSGGLSSDAQQNTVGGTNAGDSFTGTDANNNTLIGFDAGTSITSADHSTALGKDALKSVTTAYGNMGLGRSAGDSLTTGQQNTCVGLSAGHSLTTQSQNVCVGEDAMAQTKGTENTSVGFQSMSLAYFGDYNVALGSKALKVVGGSSDGSGGDYNVAIGYKAGDALETGSNCIIIGKNAAATSDSTSNEITLGDANITKFRVPGIDVILKDNGGTPTQGHVLTVDANGEAGFAAAAGGLSSDAQYNTVGGTNAGDSFTGTDATDNTLIGYNAGTALTTGDRNTVTGSGCGDSMTTTSYNTGMGYQSLSSLTTGSQHVAIGDWASKSVVGGNYSTAVGSRALYNATAGFNEAFGREALYACTSGEINTALGGNALSGLTTGYRNVALGYQSANDITTGFKNTCLGEYAGDTLTTGDRNIIIGSYATPSSATVDNEITLGDTNITKFRIPGLNFNVDSSGNVIAAKSIVSENLSGRNMIINGDMRVNQRATSVSMSSAGNTYDVCDRWQFNRNGVTSTLAQVDEAPDGSGFKKSLKITTTSAVGSISAGNMLSFGMRFETQDVKRLGYGSSDAKTATISFWVRGSLSGKIGVNCARDSRTFSANEDIVANTWKFVEIVIPADTSTGLSAADTAAGFDLAIRFAAGSNFTSGTTGGNWIGFHTAYAAGFTAGQQGAYLTTNGSTIQVTGVQLEIGSKATPFEHRSIAEELHLCQRYCQRHRYGTYHGFNFIGRKSGSSTVVGAMGGFLPMRDQPTSTVGNVAGFKLYRITDGSTHTPSSVSFTMENYTPYNILKGTLACTTFSTGDLCTIMNTNQFGDLILDAEL